MYDLIIIGAGPAGLTAGIYAGRYRLSALIIEKTHIGGQIILSTEIDNFPGFPAGITTSELIERFKKQVAESGVPILMDEVIEVSLDTKSKIPFYNIKTYEKIHQTKAVIIASGAYPKQLAVKGEEKFIGRGVSYCGTCDGPLFRDKHIAIVGGGDRAVEEAIFLAGYASKVTLVHRREHLRASKILVEKLKGNPNMDFIWDSVIEEISGKDKLEELKIKNLKTGAVAHCHYQGLFIFIGTTPNTNFLQGTLHLDETGFVITDERMKASKDGIYACGDCRKKSFYQVINACGEGAVAADSAHKYLLTLKES